MGTGVLSVDDRLTQTPSVEGVSLEALAEVVGTPAFVYSSAVIRERYQRLTTALAGVPHRIHYSVKANGNLAILSLMRSLGAGVDIVSGGELFRSLRAGFSGSDVVFSGVGKSAAEIGEALDARVLLFNVESEHELRLISEIAAKRGATARVALRVNPEVDVETAHSYIGTGRRGDKFGIPYDEVLHVAQLARSLPAVELVGLDMHVGSQLSAFDALEAGIDRIRELVQGLREDGHTGLRLLDLGGGLAVPYAPDDPELHLERYAELVKGVVQGTNLKLIIEPGRYIAAEAGLLLTRVLQRKRSGGKEYVIVDGGMTELLRPSHYDAYHGVSAVGASTDVVRADLVGPVCESGDFLALDRELPAVQPGELVVVHNAGAYGFVMSSNYNARPRVAEVLVDGDSWAIVRERETYDDLIRGESVQPDWRSA